jgi:hypothetical protein
MATGHYDSLPVQVDELASRIEADIIKLSTGTTPLDILAHMTSVALNLRKYAKLARNLECYRGGEWDEETLRQSLIPKSKQKLPKVAPPLVEIPREPTLEDLIGPRDTRLNRRYWMTMQCWLPEKNKSPIATAKAWLKVTGGKEENELKIFKAATVYRDCFLPPCKPTDERKFMQAPLGWLTSGAWHNTMEEP